MKKLLILLAIALLPACNSTQANQEITETTQQEVKAQSNQGVSTYIEKYIKAFFDYTDKNKDGVLTLEEINNNDAFISTDENKDGKIDLDEFKKAFLRANTNIFSKEKLREILVDGINQKLGGNIFKYSETKKTYDGFITKEQFSKYISGLTNEPLNIFYVADKNNNGKLSFSEFEDCYFALGKASFDKTQNTTINSVPLTSNQGVNSYTNVLIKLEFENFDKNKDGFITRDEGGIRSEYFDSLDPNKDGKIDLDEFTKFYKINFYNKEGIRIQLLDFVSHYLGNNTFTATYSGFMSKEQFIALTTKVPLTKEPLNIFYVADKNNDGKLSFSEFEDSWYALVKSVYDNKTN